MDAPARTDNYHIKIQRMIRFSQQMPSEKAAQVADSDSTMYFPMPFSVDRNSIKKATLLVYVEEPEWYNNELLTLRILSNRLNKYIANRHFRLKQGSQWQHVDITEESQSWVDHEWTNNLGLVAEVMLNGVNLVNYNSSIKPTNETFSRLPLVKLEINAAHHQRQKRSLSSDLPLACSPEDQEKRCCKYRFVIDFDTMGSDYDFIVVPRRYYANYCKGTCPKYHIPANPHYQLTLNVKTTQRCCAPSEYSSLNIIFYHDNGSMYEGDLPGMSISACSCG
ncbi:hypothetical protein EB796_018728 [Bugula neritina]|uniref:TGF-beta family profile domain-containing protein n=1 Tax=Bugula neritina TaxID=10212 RepID=A0A7J7J9R3_BUGNE|nr:hypothetical protein EB796_018728 [Bugula neritina]